MLVREKDALQVSTRYISINRLVEKTIYTYINEIDKVFVGAVHKIVKIFVSRHPYLSTGVWRYDWVVVFVKEDLASA